LGASLGSCQSRSQALATESAGEGEILGLDSDALGVDGSEIGVLEGQSESGVASGKKWSTSNSETRYASAASCRAITADDWKRRSVCKKWSAVSKLQKRGSTHFEILGDFTHETLEGELADEELRGLLVASDFVEGDGSRPEPVGLFDTTGGLVGAFAGSTHRSELIMRCDMSQVRADSDIPVYEEPFLQWTREKPV
jgi:hypothetical protein